ncbi:hypothetical protein Ciccas_009730, partial [Cichlidogyrus casuarinus]
FEDFTARTSKTGMVLREHHRENMVEADAAISRSDHTEKIKSIDECVVTALPSFKGDSEQGGRSEEPISTSKFSLCRAIHVYESLKPRMKSLVDPFKYGNEENYNRLCARLKKPNIYRDAQASLLNLLGRKEENLNKKHSCPINAHPRDPQSVETRSVERDSFLDQGAQDPGGFNNHRG